MDSITNWFNDLFDLIVAAVIPTALVALLVFLLVRRYVKPPQVVINEFKSDDALCSSDVLSAIIITEITAAGAGRELERIADSSAVTAFDFAALAGDREKWIVALLQAVSLRRKVRISGIAFTTNPHEVVINVSIANTRNVVAESRAFALRDPDKDPKVLLGQLVHDAASWTLYALNRVIGNDPPRNLGTSDWRSWGRFRRGVWLHEQGMDVEAVDAYSEALEYDPDNWGAWLNYGSLDTRTRPTRALDRLRMARQLVERDGSPQLEPAYYRLSYLLGIVHLNCSVREEAARRLDHQRDAIDITTRLVVLSAQVRRRLVQSDTGTPTAFDELPRKQREDLLSTIGLIQPTAIALLASAKVNAGVPIVGRVPDSSDPVTDDEWQAAQLDLANLDDTVTPHQLLQLLRRLMADEQFLPGADYNLACMYSRALESRRHGVHHDAGRDELVRCAFRHLARAVETGNRAEVAQHDPAFKPLRAEAPDRWWKVVTSKVPQPTDDVPVPADGERLPEPAGATGH